MNSKGLEIPVRMAVLGVATSAAIFSSVTFSQESGVRQLEEVIVSAQRREESIQDVAIAISAFSEEDLEKLGAVSMERVARVTPGLYFREDNSIKSSGTSIRGIRAVSGSAGADPSVGYYIDEVYLGNTVGSVFDLYDAERIEVLRGPQGTLYGRNTIGGVINVTSKRPTDELSGKFMAQVGNYDFQRYMGTISGPLIEGKLNGLITGLYHEREGYMDNAFLGTDTNDRNQWGVRTSLHFTPSERWDFLLSADAREVDQKAQTFETLANDDASLLGSLGLLVNRDPEDRVTFGDFPGAETLEDAYGVSLRGVYTADSYEIVGVGGYRTYEYFVDGESDLLPFGIGRNFDPEDLEMWTGELRISSRTDNDLQWLAGVYYSEIDSTNDGGILIQNDLLTLLGAGFLGEVSGGSRGEHTAETFALFASFDYRFSDQWELTLGARHTWEEKDFFWVQQDLEAIFGAPILGGTGSAEASDSWNETTPTVTLRYRPTDDVMLFATYSRGFKSGGYNVDSGVPEQQSEGFDPEFLDNFEIGIKSTWLDQRLLVNASIYSMIWEDIHIRADDPSTPESFDPRITNAGEAHSDGVELEVKAILSDRLSLYVAGNYIDAGYDEGELPVGVGAGIPLDHFTATPEYTLSADLEYVIPLPGEFDLTLRGEYRRQGETYLDPRPSALDPFNRQSAYTLYNARATLNADNWYLALWGYNLSDETYLVSTFDLLNNPFVSQYFSVLGAPRTYGVELQYTF